MVFEEGKISATIHSSLLSIINRYIIMFPNEFFGFLNKVGIQMNSFIDMYFKNMEYLTSRTAMKINSIALISLLNLLSPDVIAARFNQMIPYIVVELENFQSMSQTNGLGNFIGRVQNSPNLRFAATILSARK